MMGLYRGHIRIIYIGLNYIGLHRECLGLRDITFISEDEREKNGKHEVGAIMTSGIPPGLCKP